MNDRTDFSDWVGRTTEAEDVVEPRLVASFRAILDPYLAPVPADDAPLCFHWCLSPAIAPMAALGRDGHPAKNLDLPPVPLPRRMWAGGSIETIAPLRIGDRVRRRSTIERVELKQGRSGDLWFVSVLHDYSTERGTAIRETQDLVYRAAAVRGAAAARPAPAPRRERVDHRTIDPDPVMLFRYSAVTFNGHRIHYDQPYATGVEGYEGLVVHGPLQATLLFNAAASSLGGAPSRFTYRGLSPAFAERPLAICRGGGEFAGRFWTEGSDGTIHMDGSATA